MSKNLVLLLFAISFPVVLAGCAEGPMWRSGKLSPWARNKWAAEEKIADTLFVRKQRMSESVNSVLHAPQDEQQKVAEELAEVVHRDPVLLLRLHGVKLLGELNCPSAVETLKTISRDYNTDVRLAAIKAWEQKPAEFSIPQLQEMIGSDTNVDVRLAATRAVGTFSGTQAVQALSLALNDPDPALQLRATESLQRVTGEPLGRDVVAWQEFVKQFSAAAIPDAAAEAGGSSIARRSGDSNSQR